MFVYSMVPNNSAARLLILKIFSLPTRLIWTYTLIKIQIIFLPTRLLSTMFYFFIYFNAFCSLFDRVHRSGLSMFCYNNGFFSFIFLLLLVSKLKNFETASKKGLHIYHILRNSYLHGY